MDQEVTTIVVCSEKSEQTTKQSVSAQLHQTELACTICVFLFADYLHNYSDSRQWLQIRLARHGWNKAL